MNKDIASIRKDYVFKKLDETDLHPNPFQQFTQWIDSSNSVKLDIEEILQYTEQKIAWLLLWVGPSAHRSAHVG